MSILTRETFSIGLGDQVLLENIHTSQFSPVKSSVQEIKIVGLNTLKIL